jgi:hypothetical protein
MPRPESKLHKIIDQIVIELKKIKTAGGYFTNLADTSVMTKPHVWYTFNAFPCVYVYYSDGTEEGLPGKNIRVTDTIKIVAKFKEDGTNDIPVQVSEFLTDLRYALSSNAQLRTSTGEDLVVKCSIARKDCDKGNMSPLGVLVIDLSVIYHEYQ